MEGINTTLDKGGNGGGGGAAAKLAVSITYTALKALRDGGKLVPGTWYRITDYTCTTTQDNTQSAEHPFDIIVRADDASHLNENGYAAHHEGDEYFANCKLEAWELKYCLDNDTNRFAWADDENGTGVIFYMKDEWNNECPYDFKNITFQRWAVDDIQAANGYTLSQDAIDSLVEAFVYDDESQPKRFAHQSSTYQQGPVSFVVDGSNSDFYYTFSWINEDGDILDASVNAQNITSDEGYLGVTKNTIASCNAGYVNAADDPSHLCFGLNNIVFMSDAMYEEGWFYGIYGITIDGDSRFMSFGNDNSSISFGNDNSSISFGNDNYWMLFGNGNYSMSFGNGNSSMSFGNYNSSMSFGNRNSQSTFGNGNSSMSFGNNNFQMSFGNVNRNLSFGNVNYSMSFGNNNYRLSFGNNNGNLSFGNGNEGLSLGSYTRNLTVYEGVRYCDVDGGSNQNSYVQNAQILNGTAGTSSSNKLQISFDENKSYIQVAAIDSSGNLRIYNPADSHGT